MSELIVIFAACGLGLLVAVPQASALDGRTSGQREVDRLLGAVERAGADFSWEERRLLGFLLGLIALAVSVPALLWQNARLLGITTGMAGALALGAGAIVGGASARLAHWAAASATAAALAALRGAPDTLEASAFRGALLSALVVDVASTLSLPAAALGASCAGAIFQMGGSNHSTSAAIAAASARTREHVARDEEQNPALVAELVGGSVGGVVASALALLAPVLFGLVLRLAFGAGSGRLAAGGLMAFASAAAVIGCSAALAAEGVALALGTSRQSPPSRDRGPAVDARSPGEFMGRSIGSSALIGLKASVIASLVIAPLLF